MYNTVSNLLAEALKREGKVIYGYKDNTPYSVIFRHNSDKNDTTDRVKIFYHAEENIKQGQLLKYRDNSYIVLNQETAENDIYYKSDLLKINTSISVLANNEEINLKCYAGDLQSVNLITGDIISVVGGTLAMIAEDNKQSRKLDINNVFTALGATWKIVNLIYKTGICYIYVERTQESSTPINYTLSIVANDEYKAEETSILTVIAKADDNVISSANIIWKSSDDNIATITSDGQLTCLAEGTITITATWAGHDISTNTTITINPKEVPNMANISISCNNTEIMTDCSVVATITVINADSSTMTPPVYNAELDVTDKIAKINSIDGDKVTIFAVDDSDNIGKTVTLRVYNTDLKIEATKEFTISGWF